MVRTAILIVALVMSAAALALSIEERLTRSDREDELTASIAQGQTRPSLTVRYVGQEGGPFGQDALKVPPGEFDGNNAVCPGGSVVIGGGASIAGPGLILSNQADAKTIWRTEIFNATDPLSTGTEVARLHVTAICLGGEGLSIRTRGAPSFP